MLSFKASTDESVRLGYHYQITIPPFSIIWHGERVWKDKDGNIIATFPPQIVYLKEQQPVNVFIPMNERYDYKIVESLPVFAWIRGLTPDGLPSSQEILIPRESFRFWPPLFPAFQVCPNRLLDFTVLNDEDRVKPFDKPYPRLDSTNS